MSYHKRDGLLPHPSMPLSDKDRVDLLKAEYSAMYSLVTLRITATQRRTQLLLALIALFCGTVLTLPTTTLGPTLILVPWALLFFVRTATTDAKSFEDAIRRIEEIELTVNAIAGESLLIFQSTHPSRHQAVGGRTSASSVESVVGASSLVLLLCGYAFHGLVPSPSWRGCYWMLDGSILALTLLEWRSFKLYAYSHPMLGSA